jgi:alpha-L-fucosidase
MFMVRPRKSMVKTPEQIRNELFAELESIEHDVSNYHPIVKNIYNYHPDCPYADQNTGIVLESHYQYWRFYPKDIIQSDETIKHLNNDRTDNQIENLVKWKKQKMPDCPVAGHMPSIKHGRGMK